MNLVTKAQQFATKCHQGVLDDNGIPYINHPRQTYEILKVVTDDENLLAAAWLHDTIEDCGVTREELEKEFNWAVADLVMEVTKEGKADNIGFYFPRLKTQQGIMLKFADRLSNLSRMEAWPPPRRRHYLKKSQFWKDRI